MATRRAKRTTTRAIRRKPTTRRKATTARKKSATRRKAKKPAKKTASKTAAKRRSRPTIKRRPVARRAPPARTFEPAAPRNRARIPVQVEFQGRSEYAAIADMSASGARLVGPILDLPLGTPLAIRYPTSGGVTAPIILAEFVRATEDGFAVHILPR